MQSWTKDFPWLEFDGEKLCREKMTESDWSSAFVSIRCSSE